MEKIAIYKDTDWKFIANKVKIRRINNIVEIDFANYVMDNRVSWQLQFTMPSIFRPSTVVYFSLYSNEAYPVVIMASINSNGDIQMFKASAETKSVLGMITYFVD